MCFFMPQQHNIELVAISMALLYAYFSTHIFYVVTIITSEISRLSSYIVPGKSNKNTKHKIIQKI